MIMADRIHHHPMEARRPLGRHGLMVGPMALGCAPIANLGREVTPEDAYETIRASWDAGARYFDVAPHYGLGLGESRLGAALRDKPREDYILSSKIGRLLVESGDSQSDDEGFAVTTALRRRRDYSRDGVRRSIESSLTRLGVDRLDIVFVHDPDDFREIALKETFPALEELREDGLITSYGAGMNQSEMLLDFVVETQSDVMMCAGRYTLLDRSGAELMNAAMSRDVSIVAAGVFNSGLLARDVPDASATFDYLPAPSELLERARGLAEVCADFKVPLPAAAAQFPLRHLAVSTVCLGARTAEQATRNAGLFGVGIPEALWAAIDSRRFEQSSYQ